LKVAALDLGTNTFLCLIVEADHTGIQKILYDSAKVVRLGEGVHKNRAFLPAALKRAEECLKEFRSVIDKHQAESIAAVATSAARDATNGHELLAMGLKYNIPISTISGEREAELSFHGIVSDRTVLDGVMGLDIGGGSTEVMGFEKRKVKGVSVDIGAVRLTEMFITSHPVVSKERKALDEFAREKLGVFESFRPKELIAAAGTPTTFAAIDLGIDFDAEQIHGHIMTRDRIEEMTLGLAQMGLDERKKVTGLDEGRADVIVAGGTILVAACDTMRVDRVTVSVRGIRYGVALAVARGEL
jgi:exopolyphosphatase / guanosine-5'-triphosphate,3'-diphosphate pyrophosphatase